MAKKLVAFFIIFFFGLLAGYDLLYPGLPPTQDGEYHVVRFYEFDKVLRAGTIYPRWAPDLNFSYGVPLFNYVYPFPNYMASFFHLFGFSFIDSFKLNLFIALIFSGVFFYLWAREFWGDIGGLVSSIFYIFSPYHFVDIYIRGSVGEVWALACFPLFLWLFTQYVKNKKLLYFISSALSLSFVIFSHNILAFMFFFFSLIYAVVLIYRVKKKKTILISFGSLIFLALSVSSIFWFPALLEKRYVTGLEVFNISTNFPELFQLLIPTWGSGFSGGDLQNQMSFQIGVANLLAVFLGCIALALYRKRNDYRWYLIGFFLFSFVVIFFFMLRVSEPLWKTLPFFNYFQFPWRFLSLMIVICSFLAGSIFGFMKEKKKSIFLASFLILFVVFLGVSYAKSPYHLQRNDAYYTSRSNFIDGTNSPGDVFNTKWMQKRSQRANMVLSAINATIIINKKKPTEYLFTLHTNKTTSAVINLAYFPGWNVFIDQKEAPVTLRKDGTMDVTIPRGNHEIFITFKDTKVRLMALLITFGACCILILLLVKKYFVIIKK